MSGDLLATIAKRAESLGLQPRQRGAMHLDLRCPAHDDRDPSLSIDERDGKIVLFCHAGCAAEDVVNALGLTWSDLFEASPPSKSSEIVEEYHYDDERGNLLYQVVRFVGKEFRQRRPSDNGWAWNLDGTRRVPYRLPQMLKAIKAGESIYIVEGEKDVHAVEKAGGVATTCSGGATKWREELSKHFKGARVTVIPDNDEPGRKHAEQVVASLRDYAAEVRILELPDLPEGGDVSDWFAAGGTFETLAQLLPTARVGDDRPEIDAGIGSLLKASGAAQAALEKANDPPRYLSSGGELVRIEFDDDGRPFTRPLSPHRLLHHLDRAARYTRTSSKGVTEECRPPMDVVHDLLASPDRLWPTLRRIVSVPVFAPDGTICDTPGYNPAAKVWYHPGDLVLKAPIPLQPSDVDVAQAVDLLLEVVADFPFKEQADKAHAIAMMLQPFARDLIDGPTPQYLIEKPEPGTGATLLATAVLWPALGRVPKVFTEAGSEEEWRKRITAALRESPDAILIENLRGKLSSAALAAVLTIDEWGDRLLGVSEMVRLPVRCLWAATANNPRLSTEMIRRTVRIRLDAGVEAPWLRKPETFRIPNLRHWVQNRRADLVGACLTIVRAWIVAGRPKGPAVLGMFDSWATTMSGILEVAGIPGLLDNTADFYISMSEDDQNFAEFVEAWWAKYLDDVVGVTELRPIAEEILDLGKGSDRSQRTILGNLLRENRDRRFGDVFVRRAGVARRAARWKLESNGTRDEREPRHDEVHL